MTPLGWAALENSVGAARLLIEYGENANEQSSSNNSSILGLACATMDASIEMIQLLVENGANIELSNNQNFTPLMIAISHRQTEIAKYLISKGANVNAKTNLGKHTPLDYACLNNNLAMVEILLMKGANPNIRDYKNLKPIDKLKSEKDKEKMRKLIKKYS